MLRELAKSGDWGRYHGPHTERLTDRFADACGCEHVHLCSSGTAAVEFALRAVGVEVGDEVVLSAYDFESNFKNVLAIGARPILVDVRPDDVQFDAGQLDDAFTDSTRAVLISHLHGGLVAMNDVVERAHARGVAVVEDACQATGGIVHGRPAGSWGDVGVHSFGGSKLLTAGRGGAVVTNRADLAQRIRLHTQRGNDVSPLSQMQAAVLLPQLERLQERHDRRAERAGQLRAGLVDREGLTAFAGVGRHDSERSPAYYKVGFRYDAVAFDGLPREAFCAAMRAEGLAVDPGFRALHRTHSRRRFRAVGDLPEASRADEDVVVLHHPVLLEPESAIDEFLRALDKIRAARRMIRDHWNGTPGAR